MGAIFPRENTSTIETELANGDPTPEMLAFMQRCARQAEANAAIYAQRSRKAFAPEARMTQAQILEAMGVSATERKPKYEDPEELRRSARDAVRVARDARIAERTATKLALKLSRLLPWPPHRPPRLPLVRPP